MDAVVKRWNGIKRAGMSEQHINPSQFRDTFAICYLRAGGEQGTLRDILGLRGKTALARYEQLSTKKIKHEPQKAFAQEHLSRPI